MSLRARIALLTGLVALLGLGLGLFLSSLLLSRLALAEMDRTLRLQAHTLLQEALAEPDRQVLQRRRRICSSATSPPPPGSTRGRGLSGRGGFPGRPPW